MGVGTPEVPEPSTSSSSSSSTSATFQVGMLLKYFDQWRSITSNRFVLNMVWGHHLQLRCCPPLFHEFQHFNVKAAAAHHPVIQKEVDELLAKGAINPPLVALVSILPCLWYLSVLGAFDPYSTWSILIVICTYLLLKMPTLKPVQQLIQHGDYAFSIDLQDAYLYVPIVKHHHHSYILFGAMCLISGRS